MNLYIIFHENYCGSGYGVGTYVRELIATLKKREINICVVNLISNKPQIEKENIDGVTYWHIPMGISDEQTTKTQERQRLYDRNIVYLLQLYIKERKDLIFHLNFPHSDIFVEELKKAFYCKIVSVAHYLEWADLLFDNLERLRNILNEENPDSFSRNIKKSVEEEKSYYSKVDHCICLTKYMQETMCRDYQLEATKTSVISNSLQDLSDSSTDIKILQKKWSINPHEKIILFAGRINEIKGVTYLINAFRIILKTYPQSRLVLAGGGKFDKYIQETQSICTKVIYTGFLDTAQLCEWYRLATVGVIPSLFEPFGLVAVEMMMHRLPMVITATSGIDEVVDETCALKVPISQYSDKVEIDANELAGKILYLLQHPKEAHKLGENGRNRYEKMYTSELFGQKMIHLYQSLIET